MNWPHLHLMINHFPVILGVVAAGTSLLALFVRRRVVWMFAAACLTLAGASAAPAFLTGHEAADVITDMPRPPKQAIHAHEEAGETAFYIMIVGGVIAAVAWRRLATMRHDAPVPSWIRAAVLIGSLVGAGAAGYAALLGGRIYHGPNGTARPAAWDSVTTPPPGL